MLEVSPTSSYAQIKVAYRRALLKFHPDKSKVGNPIDIAKLKDAYNILSSPSLRAEYDQRRRDRASTGPRPAQLISLEDFDEAEEGVWYHTCRCGGAGYVIKEEHMEAGTHLIACDSCSEVVWVGYEIFEEESS